MKSQHVGAVYCSLLAAIAWSQSIRVGSEPSPMEAFAHGSAVRTIWSSEAGRLSEGDDTRALFTALVLEDDGTPARKMRGVKVDLSTGGDHDEIYLDEDATARTRSALDEIAVARMNPNANRCMGAREFGPKYDWPWNKYHELNAMLCGGPKGSSLVLYGRGKDTSFRFPGETPTHLARILADAMDQLKQH